MVVIKDHTYFKNLQLKASGLSTYDFLLAPDINGLISYPKKSSVTLIGINSSRLSTSRSLIKKVL